MNVISLINALPFGNPAQKGFFLYSKVPQKLLDALEADNFKKTIAFVYKYSKFYKRRFDELGINPKSIKRPQDLGDFYTTAEDIREHVEDFVCLKPDTAFESTGTTSKIPKRVYFNRDEVREAGWAGAVGLWGVGVRPADRVVSAFDYSFWVSGPVLQASCQTLGCFHVEAGRLHPEEFYERVKNYKVTVIVGDPSWLVSLTETAQRRGVWPIKLMLGSGENMTEETRKYIESVWKVDFLLSYGQTEAFGAIGMETRDKDGYHLNEFHNLFEVINTDPKGYGELVYTTLNRRVMPLIRYRSGDVTRFLNSSSASGLPGRRIEKLKGRINEWTATAIGNIAPWMFEPIFNGIRELGPDWQIVLEKEGNKDLIQFHVESPTNSNDHSRLKTKFFQGIETHLKDAWSIYKMEVCRMDVLVHSPGALRKGRKLSRLVDNRQF